MNYDLEHALTFSNALTTAPDMVISEIGGQLESITKGFVRGIVKKYDGSLLSAGQHQDLSSIASALGSSMAYKDIQQELGPVGQNTFQFEFFLSAPKLEHYKYRILFLEYGIGCYPVKLILEQGIADEIFGTEHADYTIEYGTKDQLANAIINILNTQKIIRIIQELIDTSQRISLTPDFS